MKYFTSKLLEKLNSRDARVVARASAAWDRNEARYEERLAAIENKLTPEARRLAREHSFHDAQLITVSYNDSDKLSLILRQGDRWHVLTYRLVGEPRLTGPDHAPRYASESLLWLYDEVDSVRGRLEHRMLFSNGSDLEIPFAGVTLESFAVTAERAGRMATNGHKVSVFENLMPIFPIAAPLPDDFAFPMVVRTRNAGAAAKSKVARSKA